MEEAIVQLLNQSEFDEIIIQPAQGGGFLIWLDPEDGTTENRDGYSMVLHQALLQAFIKRDLP